MKRLLTLVAFFATVHASAQQVNPVPDYVFRNQMSVGRGTVTDTAAYFSIGPRYGATKGFMPPIVGDTATFSSGKRNGLLIFSVQKNKFLYWDSVRVQWSDMAGSSGAYIVAGDTSAMLAPYLRKSDTSSMLGNYVRHAGYGLTKSGQSFLVDTLNISTRAWRQKGLDSLAALEVSGSGTTNYVPKFTAGSTIGNSQIFDDGSSVGIGITPTARLHVGGTIRGTGSITGNSSFTIRRVPSDAVGSGAFINFDDTSGAPKQAVLQLNADHGLDLWSYTTAWNRLFSVKGSTGNTIFGGNTDAGYKVDVQGNLRTTTGANFATTSGEVLIGTTTDAGDYKLQVNGNIYFTGDAVTSATSRLGIGRTPTADLDIYRNAGVTTEIVNNNNGSNLAYNADIWTMNITGRRNSSISQANARIKVTYNGDGTTRKGRMSIGVAESSGYGNANVVFTTTPGNRKVSIFGYSTEAYTDTTFSLTSNYVLHGYLMVNGYSLETVPVASFDIDGNASTVMHSSGNWSFGSTTDSGGYRVRVTGDMLVTSSITTGAPTDGTAAPWRLGSYNATAPTATGYVEVLVNGVKYKLLAATY